MKAPIFAVLVLSLWMSNSVQAEEEAQQDALQSEAEQVQQEAQLKSVSTQAKTDIVEPEPLSRDEVLLELGLRLAEATQGS